MRTLAAAMLVLAFAPAANGQSVRALLESARTQAARGDSARAVDTLRQARALAPNSEEILSAYARVALAARAPREAIAVLEPLVRMCPAEADYPYLLGVALLQVGSMPEAIAALRASEALNGERAMTFVALGLGYNKLRLHMEARAALERAMQLQPDSLEAAAALAEAHEGLDDLDAAEALARKVLGGTPDAPSRATAQLVLGMALTKRGRDADAREPLLAATASENTMQKAHYQLSLLYARLGDDAASQRHLAEYRTAREETEARVREAKRP